jgi:hypothetical protein
MAGYLISLDSLDSLHLYTQNGAYATKLSQPPSTWLSHHEGTFADYATMKAGDNIYFFIKRRIYGIGRLTNVGGDCKFFNYPEASQPKRASYHTVKGQLLWDEGEDSARQRCLCLFEPDPYFFRLGIDMDDVLSSNPAAFKMLRAFWKLSFIKFGDEENQAFRDILLKRNQAHLTSSLADDAVFAYDPMYHKRLAAQPPGNAYPLNAGMAQIMASCAEGNYLRHEMAIEAGILHQLSLRDTATCNVFGEWDYLSHQVIASPFKPVDYMDKMDLFGYAYIPDFRPTKFRFLVGEIKKDAADQEDVDQLLKYVDWVRDEYCFGDYAMIRAFLVAYDFNEEVIQHKRVVGLRKYTIGVRPAQSLEWNDLNLIGYSFNETASRLDFRLVD